MAKKQNKIILPGNLEDEAKQMVAGILKRLEKDGRLNQLDEVTLYMLACSIKQFVECYKTTEREGLITYSDRNNQTPNPYFTMQTKLTSSLTALLKEMGLTLASRVKLNKGSEAEEDDSPLKEFLKFQNG